MVRPFLACALGIVLGAGGLFAWQTYSAGHAHQPYAGQDARAISSLSPADIAQLERGAGWGLAKPAELNGYPGPLHVLELADDLALSDEQRQRVQAAFDAMNAKARELGAALIEAERSLDEAFRANGIDDATLAARLREAERARAALRRVHLTAHLEVTPLLSDEQKTKYASLRGYGSGGHHHGGH